MSGEKKALSIFQAEFLVQTLGRQHESAVQSGDQKQAWEMRSWIAPLLQAVEKTKIETMLPSGWWETWLAGGEKKEE